MAWQSDPWRDRREAFKPRYGPRAAESLDDAIGGLVKSEEWRRLRRHRRISDVLDRVVPAMARARVRPLSLKRGTLTLGVADNLLLAELRNHHHGQLVHELIEAGTGVTRVVYRREKS
ncbi:MAG: DciA family protein [Planctomycetota bacterium]|jgi:hypothetical protein